MNEPVAVPRIESAEETMPSVKKNREPEFTVTDEGLDLSSYRGTHDAPFIADYFEIRDLYKTNEKVQEQVDEITEYMIKQTEGQSIVFAVKELLNEMSQEMNLQRSDAGLYKLKKVLGFIRVKNKLNAIDNMKKRVLEDIENVV